MICRRCGKGVDKGWRFCPNCGSGLEERSRSLFDDIFSRFRREFDETDRMFDREFEVLDLSPFFRNLKRPRGTGFTIKITRRGGEQPKVDVKTFGNVNPQEVRKEVAQGMKSLGLRPVPPVTEKRQGPQERPAERTASQPAEQPREQPEESPAQPPRVTEEPKTQVRSVGTKVMVEMELPDVKSRDDIEVKELESSVEVRARAGDKAYFKIITKPEQFSVKSKSFENGRLHLEFS